MASSWVRSLAMLVALLSSWPALAGRYPQGEYGLVESKSLVSAKVAYLGVSQKTVRFPSLKGDFQHNAEAGSAFQLLVTADASLLDAGDATDTGLLKGEDFFDTARFRTVVFRGTRMTITGARTANVDGMLTVRSVSRPMTLKVTFPRPLAEMEKDGVLELSATARFKRSAFGMKAWPVVVGDKVNLNISARFERK